MAIAELKIELSKPTRNENKIQICLTNNPILLGLDYLNVLPKYELGSEYQVDYALEKYWD